MIQIRNTRQIIIGFIVFSIIFFLYSEKVVDTISSLSPFWILLIVPLLNPIYLIFIFSLFKEYGFKGVLAGFIIAISTTLISIPHIITKGGETSEAYFNMVTDISIWKMIPDFIKFDIGGVNFGSIFMYIGISTLLIVLALMIVHKKKFKEIFLKSA